MSFLFPLDIHDVGTGSVGAVIWDRSFPKCLKMPMWRQKSLIIETLLCHYDPREKNPEPTSLSLKSGRKSPYSPSKRVTPILVLPLYWALYDQPFVLGIFITLPFRNIMDHRLHASQCLKYKLKRLLITLKIIFLLVLQFLPYRGSPETI